MLQRGLSVPAGYVNYVERSVRNVSLTSVEISGCVATLRQGGGLLEHSGSHVTLKGVVIANNTADKGGGVCILGSLEGLTPVEIQDSVISGNKAAEGAGMFFEDGTFDALVRAKHIQHKLSLSGTEFAGNVASSSGGGLKLSQLRDDWAVHTHTGQELMGLEVMSTDFEDPDVEYDWPMEWFGRWTLSPDSRYVYAT